MTSPHDPNSYANTNDFQTEHVHFDWNLDFTKQIIHGQVVLTLNRVSTVADCLRLDSHHLKIEKCFNAESGKELDWSMIGTYDSKFGQALEIRLDSKAARFAVRIDYATTAKCSALQWLKPEQTFTKREPYLFSQCQAIHARSLAPLQDTPSVKITYSAKVKVQAPLRVVMSAQLQSETKESGVHVYEFKQPVSIPSYLIAIAAGALVGLEIGPRSTVWSEQGMVEVAAKEFTETETFLKNAEDLLIPYEWGRYDLLVLPPSFPYGGMENPCLTFVTPTIIAGDRSLVDVVAHEIAHSWAGNLATNRNWEHFWLNEGFCVFIERKILGRIYGEPVRQFKSILGWKSMEESVALFGDQNPLTALVTNLKNVDPDDAFSSIPYEKGFNFLYHLETVVGGSAVFEPFLKAFYKNFSHKTLTTEDMKQFLFDYMKENHPSAIDALNGVDWKTWLHSPGMPPVSMPFDQTLANECKDLAKKWDLARNQSVQDVRSQLSNQYKDLTPGQQLVFLEKLAEYPPLPESHIALLAELYDLKSVKNSEIRFRFQELCLRANYEAVFPDVVQFVTEQGRMKFTRPLYRALFKCPKGKQLAMDTFKKHRSFYHPICSQMVAKDILGE